MLLYGLSRDALAEIWRLVSISDLCQLRCTGDSHLITVLERGSIQHLTLKAETKYMFGRLPQLVSQIAATLTFFELRTTQPLAQFPRDIQIVLKAMSNLRTLNLHTPEAEEILETKDLQERASLRVKLDAALGGRDAQFPRDPRMIDLSRWFPSLETLTVHGGRAILLAVDFCVAPPSLLHLSIPENSDIDDTIFQFLPSTIKSLTLGRGIELGNGTLPQHLEVLKWWRRAPKAISEDIMKRLPPNLNSLTIVSMGQKIETQTDLYALLPPTLTALQIHPTVLLRDAIQLPKGLLELRALVPTPEDVINIPTLLPPSLTDLYLEFSRSSTFETPNLTLLPPTLTKLVISGHSGAETMLIGKLPPKLTHLTLEVMAAAGTGSYPETLTHLRIRGPSSTEPGQLNLPLSLRTLDLETLYPHDIPRLPPKMTMLRVSNLGRNVAALPRSLTSIITNTTTINALDVAQLPPNLMVLRVTRLAAGDVPESLSACQWPRSLLVLDLMANTTQFFDFDSHGIRKLPPSLKEFHVQGNLPVALIHLLPRDLTYLGVRGIQGDLDAHVRELPRHLTRLDVPSIVGGVFSSKSVRRLPRSLKTITLSMEFNEVDFHYMPAHVTSYHFSANRSIQHPYEDYKGPYDPATREILKKHQKSEKCIIS